MRRPQPWRQESFRSPFFKAYVASAVDRLQDNVLLKGENDVRLGWPWEAVGPPDVGVGEVDIAPGGLGLVLGNLSDEPLWLIDGDEEGARHPGLLKVRQLLVLNLSTPISLSEPDTISSLLNWSTTSSFSTSSRVLKESPAGTFLPLPFLVFSSPNLRTSNFSRRTWSTCDFRMEGILSRTLSLLMGAKPHFSKALGRRF